VVGGHDGSFLILDHVGSLDVVIGVRSHTGEMASVYLMDADIEKLVEFLSRRHDHAHREDALLLFDGQPAR